MPGDCSAIPIPIVPARRDVCAAHVTLKPQRIVRGFQDFLKTPKTKQIFSTPRVRKAPSTEVVEQPSKKVIAVTAVEQVRVLKARSGVQFRGGATAVLRTG